MVGNVFLSNFHNDAGLVNSNRDVVNLFKVHLDIKNIISFHHR